MAHTFSFLRLAHSQTLTLSFGGSLPSNAHKHKEAIAAGISCKLYIWSPCDAKLVDGMAHGPGARPDEAPEERPDNDAPIFLSWKPWPLSLYLRIQSQFPLVISFHMSLGNHRPQSKLALEGKDVSCVSSYCLYCKTGSTSHITVTTPLQHPPVRLVIIFMCIIILLLLLRIIYVRTNISVSIYRTFTSYSICTEMYYAYGMY